VRAIRGVARRGHDHVLVFGDSGLVASVHPSG
jgi:hypothetical protein